MAVSVSADPVSCENVLRGRVGTRLQAVEKTNALPHKGIEVDTQHADHEKWLTFK